MLIVLRPYFPKCGDLLEAAPRVNASKVMSYFQLIVEIVHTLFLDRGMTETGGERDNGKRTVLDRAALISSHTVESALIQYITCCLRCVQTECEVNFVCNAITYKVNANA